jgi:hypothetical protein
VTTIRSVAIAMITIKQPNDSQIVRVIAGEPYADGPPLRVVGLN